MKKRTLSFLLALVMCLSLLPMTALAAYTPDPAKFDAPIISDLAVSEPDENGEAMLTFVLKNPDSIKNALAHYNENSDGAIWDINGQVSIDGGEWQKISITNGSDFAEGARETIRIKELHVDSQIKFRTYYTGWDVNGYYSGWYGDEMGKYSNVLTLNEKIDINASDWAKEELARADELGLIPDCLEGEDLTQDITRAEFADDKDISDWAKDSVYFMAANGIIAGVGDNTFAPKAVTTEQQAAGYAQATREQALTIAVRMVENFGK